MSQRKKQSKKHTGQTRKLKQKNRPPQQRSAHSPGGGPPAQSQSPMVPDHIPLAERNRMEALAYHQKQETGVGTGQAPAPSGQSRAGSSQQTAAKRARQTDKLAQPTSPQAKKKERDQAKKANARRRHRRARRAKRGSYLLLLLFVLAGGVVLSMTVFFNITSVTVSDHSPYSAAEFMQIMGVQEGDNLWRLQIHQMEQEFLKQKIDLDAVKITRQFPNTLQVTMTPAEEQWRILEGERYYSVSAGGRLLGLSEASVAGGETVVLSGIPVAEREAGDFLTEMDEYQLLMKVWQATQDEEVSGITGIFLDGGNLSMGIEWRILAKLGGVSELSYKISMMEYLRKNSIGSTEYGVLDLYLPAKGFFEQMTQKELYEKFPHIRQ